MDKKDLVKLYICNIYLFYFKLSLLSYWDSWIATSMSVRSTWSLMCTTTLWKTTWKETSRSTITTLVLLLMATKGWSLSSAKLSLTSLGNIRKGTVWWLICREPKMANWQTLKFTPWRRQKDLVKGI